MESPLKASQISVNIHIEMVKNICQFDHTYGDRKYEGWFCKKQMPSAMAVRRIMISEVPHL